MSGIVGILNLDGAPVDRELLERMTAFQSFRGPDRQDLWIDGAVGFGHTLSKTTTESERERQPCSLDGHFWITADARVDAREDLISKLRGHCTARLDSLTDPELILHAYNAWGEDCLQHLLGDFSFALWDGPHRRLLCAVDHFGVKPFYYAQVGNTFVFSNTLDCVRLHPLVSDRFNEVAIGDFLLFGYYQDRDITVYADVPRLPPGHFLLVGEDGSRRSRYWSLPEVPQLRLRRPAEYVERFQELLDKAVGDRLRTNRVGVFLSGGLDSPLLAATASRLLKRQCPSFELGAFTVVFDHLIPDDERHYATLVGESLGIPVQFRAADDAGLYDWLDRCGWLPPEPVHNPTWGFETELMREIAPVFPIALTGYDGDAILRGTVRLHWLDCIREGRWLRLARDVAWYVASQRGLPPIGFRTCMKQLFGGSPKRRLPAWLNPDFALRAGLAERWAHFTLAEKETSARSASLINLALPLWTPLFDSYDPGWTGCAGEVRHPLMDVRVVTFAIALPTVPWCVGKELLRRCLEDSPLEVRSRPKTPLQSDPIIGKLKKIGVSTLNCHSIEPELLQFVDELAIPAVDPRGDSDSIWSSLRPLSLNYWFMSRVRSRNDDEGRGIGRAPAAGTISQEAV